MTTDLLDQYERQVEVAYRDESYLVRDNGAVCRTRRPAGRQRKLDDVWTFGQPNASSGYMNVSSHVVHCIVALAYHEQPSKEHVVDHIDTNRRNNRADNLRWVTRLENLLLNPITRARIIHAYGSLDAFFKDPSALGERVPDYSWMRPVTREEAEESRNRLMKWAEADRKPGGGHLGEWVYGPGTPRGPVADISLDQQSLTPMAVQRNWKTLSEFPACPNSIGSDALGEYAGRLKPGTVFCTNRFGDAVTETAGSTGAVLAVLCRMPELSVKDWALSRVEVENDRFVHESAGTYFSMEGAWNAYSRLLGVDPPYGETIDDFC